MNSGGEPERDNSGLPPVDIEIPDDARELDRDVQAYYREQRAERRRLRHYRLLHHRLHGTLTRDGILLPLLACCLILALITGTLLTVFSAASDQNLTRLPTSGTATRGPTSSAAPARGPSTSSAPAGSASTGGSGSTGGSASAVSPHVVQTRQPLPAGTLTLAGGQRVRLQSLDATLLVLVPSACGCGTTVNWLAVIGASQRVRIYLVGTPQTIGEANRLRSRLSATIQAEVQVALDKQSLLAHKYPVRGPTAVMVAGHSRAGQSAAYAQHLSPTDSPAPLIRALDG